jgi:uncharacterized iron-regulated membrane protein
MVIRGRNFWMAFHRWLGLVTGLLIAVLGITGSILVFEHDIDSALNPALLRVAPAGELQSFNAIVGAAEQTHPGWTARYFQRHGDDPATAFMVLMRDPAGAEKQVFVNPYTLQILGERSGLSAVALIRHIHGDLVLGDPWGSGFVGVFSFVCIGFFIAGIVLWWPAKGGAKRALTLSGNREPKRFMRELHNVFGIWPAVLFIIASITVPPLVWMGSTEGGPPPPNASAPRAAAPDIAPSEPPRVLTWDEAAAFAATETPGQYVGLMLRQDGPRGIYLVRFWPKGQSGVYSQSNVIMPLTGGRIIRVQRPAPYAITSITKTDFAAHIHSGAILGLPGRWVMFAVGLFLPVLFITGVMMWVLGRRKKAS